MCLMHERKGEEESKGKGKKEWNKGEGENERLQGDGEKKTHEQSPEANFWFYAGG